jgi:hypothetical protein
MIKFLSQYIKDNNWFSTDFIMKLLTIKLKETSFWALINKNFYF